MVMFVMVLVSECVICVCVSVFLCVSVSDSVVVRGVVCV